MEDYKIIMTELLLQYYDPTPEGGQTIQMHTSDILRWFRGIIPSDPINEHDVFDVLKQAGFQQSQKILTEKVCIYEGDGTKEDPPEYDNVEVGRVLIWNLYEKQ